MPPCLLLLLLSACTTEPRGAYQPLSEQDRSTALAERLSREAADVMDKEPAKAEKLLRDALTADLYFGPGHNNLGVLFLKQGKLYEAANEFEWARKLLPGHPDPRFNLAMTLERAGRIDDALATYETALEVYETHMPSKQALVRLRIRHGRADAETRGLLEEIGLRGETDRWRDWARMELATMPQHPDRRS